MGLPALPAALLGCALLACWLVLPVPVCRFPTLPCTPSLQHQPTVACTLQDEEDAPEGAAGAAGTAGASGTSSAAPSRRYFIDVFDGGRIMDRCALHLG